MSKETKSLAKVNGQAIVVIENGQKLVPIKPICDALGIAHQPQYEKIKSHPILSSVVTMIVTTGSDEKNYEMLSIPFEFIFGWLFTIDPRKVKPESVEAVTKYQRECYHVLYKHFTDPYDFLLEKQTKLDIKLAELDLLQKKALATKADVQSCKAEIEKIRSYSLDQWQAEKKHSQLEIPYTTPAPETSKEINFEAADIIESSQLNEELRERLHHICKAENIEFDLVTFQYNEKETSLNEDMNRYYTMYHYKTAMPYGLAIYNNGTYEID